MISKCWLHNPDKRSTFSALADSLNSLLKSQAGYLDLTELDSGERDDLYDTTLDPRGDCDHLQQENYETLKTLNAVKLCNFKTSYTTYCLTEV